MGGRSEGEIREELRRQQAEMAKLLNAGKTRDATQMLLDASKKGMKDLLDLPYQGKKVRDVDEYKEAKKLTDDLFRKVWKIYWDAAPFPLQKLMQFCDEDYMISLYQGMDVVGVFNQHSAEMDARLKTWFVLGFYAFEYELAGKPLLSYVGVLTTKIYSKVGVATRLLTTKYSVEKVKDYFEPFLRNAIDHSSYIVTDVTSGKIAAWNAKDGRTTSKKDYDLVTVFGMTVRLIFFITAYFASWYELVIELDRRGALWQARNPA